MELATYTRPFAIDGDILVSSMSDGGEWITACTSGDTIYQFDVNGHIREPRIGVINQIIALHPEPRSRYKVIICSSRGINTVTDAIAPPPCGYKSTIGKNPSILASYSPNGSYNAVGFSNSCVRIKDRSNDFENWTVLRSNSVQGDLKRCLFAHDGNDLLICYEYTLLVYNIIRRTSKRFKDVRCLSGSPFTDCKYSLDGTYVIASYLSGDVVMWKAKTRKFYKLFRASVDLPLKNFVVSHDSTRLLTVNVADGTSLWSIRTGKCIRSATSHEYCKNVVHTITNNEHIPFAFPDSEEYNDIIYRQCGDRSYMWTFVTKDNNSVLYMWNCDEVASKLAESVSVIDDLSTHFPSSDVGGSGGSTLEQMMDEM